MPKSKEFLTSSDSESGDSDEPKQKKKKPQPKPEKKKEVEGEESEKGEKASKSTKGPGGEVMFQLAKMRYATVSEFRGKVMVGIREYYEKDGKLLPGKKGISLSAEQWQALKDNIGDIDECLNKF